MALFTVFLVVLKHILDVKRCYVAGHTGLDVSACLLYFILFCIPMRGIYPWNSDSARYPAWFCYAVRCLLSSGKFLFFFFFFFGLN